MTPVLRAWLADTGRRALLTATQVAIAALTAATTIGQMDWVTVGLTVALAVIVTVLKATATSGLADGLPVWGQVVDRVVATAAEAAVGVIGASVLLTDVDWARVAGVAGVAAGLALLGSVQGILTGTPPAGARWLDADGDGRPDVGPTG